jgi:ElaB/YqjD/DUF883 family membrane-anchored ribosome-binding protein
MSKLKKTVNNDMNTLAEGARELLAATSEVAGEKVAEVRQRLNGALERGKVIYSDAQDKAIAGAKAGDKLVRNHAYAAVGIAVSLGALLGYVLARRSGE